MPNISMIMLKLIKNFTKKEYLLMIVCFVLIFAQVWLELKMPDYMSEITILVQSDGSNMRDILINGGFMLLCAFGSLISAAVVGYFIANLSSSFSMKTRKKLFDKVESLSMQEVKAFSTSSLITRTTNDITQVEMFIGMGLQLLVKAPITAIWAITKILNKSWQWSLITAIAVLILLTVISILTLVVVPKFKIVQKLIDKVNGVTRENLTGIRVIRAFGAEQYQENKFDEVNQKLTKQQLFNQRMFAIMSPIMYLVMYFLTLSIYFVGALLIKDALLVDKLSLFGDMVVFSSYAMQIIMSFLMLAMIFMMLPRASVSAKRINEVLDTKICIEDGIITDVIGSTGSGKSTLINLIPRFYDVTSGEVLVDGVNVKEYKLSSLYNKLGYVPQKAVMFNGTVKSNVSYGNNGGKKANLNKVKEAIKVAQATEFVEKMDDKYDTHIAQGGTNVSGGQKQRLAIARAIARNPEIYIFDDSFSALDYKTDSVLRKELKKYTKDATILIVAQRIGTIMNADKIIVLDNGKCVGEGTHKELLNNCEVYKQIALSQLSKEELENA